LKRLAIELSHLEREVRLLIMLSVAVFQQREEGSLIQLGLAARFREREKVK
jgi:hypothetical protein